MYEDFQPRMNVRKLAALAEQRLQELRSDGEQPRPVVATSRSLASNFWGKAWMRHLALCEAGGLSLAPGRSLLRHGCVLDLRIGPGRISALVSAEELFDVELTIAPLDEERKEQLKAECGGHIGSLVELLEGKVDAAVLERLCDPCVGLLPEPTDWKMRCSCPDWSEPCPHAAAAIYAAGVLLDAEPELLFTLRSFTAEELMSATVPEVSAGDFDAVSLGAIFGIDLETE